MNTVITNLVHLIPLAEGAWQAAIAGTVAMQPPGVANAATTFAAGPAAAGITGAFAADDRDVLPAIQTSLSSPTTLAIVAAALQGQRDMCRFAGHLVRAREKFTRHAGADFSLLTAQEQARRVWSFMNMGRDSVFALDILPLGATFRRLADESKEPLGNCHNLSLAFFFLASGAGMAVGYYRDLYHAFASITGDDCSEIPVDFAYGDAAFFTSEYVFRDSRMIHAATGRGAIRLCPQEIAATFLNLQGLTPGLAADERRAAFHGATILYPNFAEGYNNMGDVAFVAGRFVEAADLYAEASRGEPYNAFFRLNFLMADFAADPRQDMAGLFRQLDDLLVVYPGLSEAHYFRYILTGNLLFKKLGERSMDDRHVEALFGYGKEMRAKLRTAAKLAGPREAASHDGRDAIIGEMVRIDTALKTHGVDPDFAQLASLASFSSLANPAEAATIIKWAAGLLNHTLRTGQIDALGKALVPVAERAGQGAADVIRDVVREASRAGADRAARTEAFIASMGYRLDGQFCGIKVHKVEPAYDANTIQNIGAHMDGESYAALVAELEAEIERWKSRQPPGARFMFVSDRWVSDENLGGSLLMRTLYGMMKESGVPVEWWVIEVDDDKRGQAYHRMNYAIYQGLMGAKDVSYAFSEEELPEIAAGYDRTNQELAAALKRNAGLRAGDAVMLIDVTPIGMAQHLAGMGLTLIDNLRISSEANNPVYAKTMDALAGARASLDAVLHLHRQGIIEPEKDICIGAFCNFTAAHNRDIPRAEAIETFRSIAALARGISTFEEFQTFGEMDERPIVVSGGRTGTGPDFGRRIFYHGSRIEAVKNIDITLRAYAQAFETDPQVMGRTELVILMPSPSAYNLAVEMESIRPIVGNLFDIFHNVPQDVREHVHIYFVPPMIGGARANARFNEALQNLSDIQINISNTEGMPNAVFDAMSHAKVALVSTAGGTPDQVQDSVTGFHVPRISVDAVAERMRHIANIGDLAHIGRAARERLVTKFNPIAYVSHLLGVTREGTAQEAATRGNLPDYLALDRRRGRR